MVEILAFIGFLSFLATSIIVIFGWYSWRTDWEQKYEKREQDLYAIFDSRCAKFNERLEQIEYKDLV